MGRRNGSLSNEIKMKLISLLSHVASDRVKLSRVLYGCVCPWNVRARSKGIHSHVHSLALVRVPPKDIGCIWMPVPYRLE